jgi:hypothetical protein
VSLPGGQGRQGGLRLCRRLMGQSCTGCPRIVRLEGGVSTMSGACRQGRRCTCTPALEGRVKIGHQNSTRFGTERAGSILPWNGMRIATCVWMSRATAVRAAHLLGNGPAMQMTARSGCMRTRTGPGRPTTFKIRVRQASEPPTTALTTTFQARRSGPRWISGVAP